MDPQNSTPLIIGTTSPSLNLARKIRVMLVDDDPMIGRGLARAMSTMGVKMDIIVRTSAEEALKTLEKEAVDAIVTDLYMPNIDGTKLLNEVRTQYPTVFRFVLSGEAKPEIMMEAARLAHQYLSKPCDTPKLHQSIVQTMARFSTIKKPEVARTITQLEGVPSRQASLAEFLHLLTDNTVPLEQIATSLKKDPGLSARLLKLANSSYFGHSGSIGSLDEAIGLLGIDLIVSMAASHKLFQVTPPPASSNLNLDVLWDHCVYVSSLVRQLGYKLKIPPAILREAGTAALLHDIGKLILAYAAPTAMAEAQTRAVADHMPSWQAEYFVLGNHHAEIGGCLLKLWGLPAVVVEAVLMHHTPHHSEEETVGPVTLVHIANTLAHSITNDGATICLDGSHLKTLNLPDDIDYWLGLLPD